MNGVYLGNLPPDAQQGEWRLITPEYYDHPLEQLQVKTEDGFKYARKKHNPHQVYKVDSSINPNKPRWVCALCSHTILSVKVVHPKQEGDAKYEDAPYCKTCEVKPARYVATPL